MTDLLQSICDPNGASAVVNPATGEEIARVRTFGPEAVTTIIERADAAGRLWSARTAKERAAVLRRWFDILMTHQEELARIVTAECGKPLVEARGEVAYGAAFIEWFAEEGKRAYGEVVPTFAAGKRVLTLRQAVGTCAAITPWNFPVAMVTRKVAPALAAGCAMVLKPAESTPLSALLLERLAREAGVPKDLFRIVPADNPAQIGQVFCEHPAIRKLSFTGSTAVGKVLMRQAARNVLRLSLELGGNAPFIVFDDADLDAAVEGAIASKYRNAGQTCVCANRFLVQDGVHDAFVEKLVRRVAGLKLAPGDEDGAEIGPLINGAAISKVEQLVAQAIEQGARALTGGKPSSVGANFFEATVLAGVAPVMAVVTSEIFGPVAPIIRFVDEQDAIRIANGTDAGLAAYFYSRDMGRIWRVMEALDFGMVAVNDGILSSEVAPFGGIKQSGLGREGARQGLDEYLEVKYCLVGGIDA